MNDLELRIAASIRRNPNRPNWRIGSCIRGGASAHLVAKVRSSIAVPEVPEAPPPSSVAAVGVPIRALRVSSRRPADSASTHIQRLPKGVGYSPAQLAAEWCISENTVRRHAKDLKCLKFVEVTSGEWVPMILNPETAKQYS